MLKDDHRPNRQAELQEDLQFILSSIRARQNGLIFFLQRLKNSQSQNSSEFKLCKNQYQQKQKIYTSQITKMILKHSESATINLYPVRAFWVKLKTILKVSIDRISSLNIPHLQKLNQCYQKALIAIARCSDAQKSLISYKQIQNYFKKRNIQALLLGRSAVSPSSISFSESKIQKNRSQTLFKPQTAVSRFTIQNQDSHVYSKGQTFNLINKDKIFRFDQFNGLMGIQQQENKTSEPKIKSLNRIKNRKPQQAIKANILNFIKVEQLGKLKSSSKASQKYIKKINKHVQRYERNFQGAFDGKYELATLLDKKKTIFQNIYVLYDNLFAKNIPNHKMIAKFMFNTTKINQLIYNAYEKKRKLNRKDKQKTMNKEDRQKDIPVNKKSNEQKKNNEDKQKEKNSNIIKFNKINRKLHSAKDFHPTQSVANSMSAKQYLRQKKQSQLTAITSKHTNNYQRQYFAGTNTQKNQKQKGQKWEKQRQKWDRQKAQNWEKQKKQKTQKQKDKKILRSKTAKIKINSQIQNGNHHILNGHLQAINGNVIAGKHFLSQNHNNKQIHNQHKGLQKLSKVIVGNI